MRLGIIGFSEGNGHPFSFSAIINGYERKGFEAADWPVILAYLDKQPAENFGFGDARVTHAWTQFPDLTQKLCAACSIANAVDRPEDMLGDIDALIIARDDWETHAALATPFLQAGIPVFIDKPLTLDPGELVALRPYVEQGMLMSTSGLRFAQELDAIVEKLPDLGPISLISATVLNGLDKYGIHMLDAIDTFGLGKPRQITRLAAGHQAFALLLDSGVTVNLNCLGSVAKTFHLSVFGKGGHVHVDLHDNFSAFRRTMGAFVEMVRTRRPPIAPARLVETMDLIRLALAMEPGQTRDVSDA
ncbi:Gfo/Idh/MocA family oxidoreductase [Devosia ginsengisoli]|uniref:Gfo/Idh/MocA-like oxidoreductase N-terminal domain-containing protein n=1 Tax=Devosia ginsengisoli TaxID=400770 RepID=A0A5B8LUB3_9HYPH|nr:Gfo/Idh/MocA family oxidoreductase [Devosia ginsengisoli]QDZ11626.1 hypothetical protein FPZ08_13185 [Devosia ginsengisoli]